MMLISSKDGRQPDIKFVLIAFDSSFYLRLFVEYVRVLDLKQASSRKALLIRWSRPIKSVIPCHHFETLNFFKEKVLKVFRFVHVYSVHNWTAHAWKSQDLRSGHQVSWCWLSRYYFIESEVIIFQSLFVWNRLATVYNNFISILREQLPK